MSRSGSEIRKRQDIVKVRCTADEVAQLALLAQREGKTVSAHMRDRALGEAIPAPKPRLRKPRADVVELARISGLLGKYGSNVNQIAHVANMDGDRITEAELYRIAAEVREVKLLILRALGRRGD